MEIKDYIRSLIKYDNPILPELEPQETTRADTRSFMEPEVAKLVNMFILEHERKERSGTWDLHRLLPVSGWRRH